MNQFLPLPPVLLPPTTASRLALLTEQWLDQPFLPDETCSSSDFVRALLIMAGVSRGELMAVGPEGVDCERLERGDILAFDLQDLPGHEGVCVGVYLGAGAVAYRPLESCLITTFRVQDYARRCNALCRPRYRSRQRSRAPSRRVRP